MREGGKGCMALARNVDHRDCPRRFASPGAGDRCPARLRLQPGRLGRAAPGHRQAAPPGLAALCAGRAVSRPLYLPGRKLGPAIIGFDNQKGAAMRWYHYVAYFFGGAFLANTLPHLINGISGNAFQSPFASPPGVGLSSSTVNVLWGLFNLAVAYLLICRVGDFNLRKNQHVLVLGAGILIMSLMLAHTFGRLHGGL